MTRPQLPPRVEELAWEIDAEAFIRQRDEHPDVTAEKDARAERAIAEADRRMRHNLERFGRPYKAPKPDRPTCSHIIGANGVTVAVMSDDGPTPERFARAEDIDPDTGEVFRGIVRETTYEKVPGSQREESRTSYKVRSDLEKMLDKGQIDDKQLAEGKKFREEFEIAGMDPLKAANLHRMGGGQLSDIPGRIMDAKDYVADCMKRAGGHGSFTGLALWWVVGRGESFAEFTRRVAWGNNAPLRQEAVPALVQSVLSILCEPRR